MVLNQQAPLTLSHLMHPEAVEVRQDPNNNRQLPWSTLYHEFAAGPMEYDPNIPVAVEVVEIEQAPVNPVPQFEPAATSAHNVSSSDRYQKQQEEYQSKPWRHSNLIDLLVGLSLSLSAIVSTASIELAAIIIYSLAAGFHFVAEEVFFVTPLILFKSVFLLVCGVLMIVDPILLTTSVLVTEILGGVALLVCSIFGGLTSGFAWQQFIRKTCHLTRWSFRSCHQHWSLERVFPVPMEMETYPRSPPQGCHDAEDQQPMVHGGQNCSTTNNNDSIPYSDDVVTTTAAVMPSVPIEAEVVVAPEKMDEDELTKNSQRVDLH
eukprot:Nitzschia sp. Nitz4//scaffold137_size62074//25506//26586//NITZ4_006415-RA/size62074-processed-gene-0.86-mRNA-1//-1//CDS//3329535700//15//frame0